MRMKKERKTKARKQEDKKEIKGMKERRRQVKQGRLEERRRGGKAGEEEDMEASLRTEPNNEAIRPR